MLKKILHYKGKKRIILPLIILLGCFNIKAEWTDLTGAISGFYKQLILKPDEITNYKPSLMFSYNWDDIYRKKVADTLTTSVATIRPTITAIIPYTFGKSHQVLKLHSQYLSGNMRNNENTTSVNVNSTIYSSSSRAGWSITDGVGCLDLDIRYDTGKYKSAVQINRFPVSDDENTNIYFLDFLPTAFGSAIDAPASYKTTAFDITGSTLILNLRTQVHYNRLKSDHTASFNYINASENQNIRGLRQLDFLTDLIQNRFGLAVIFSNKFLQHITIDYFTNYLTYNTHLNAFGATDFDDLGKGTLKRAGLSTEMEICMFSTPVSFGINTVKYTGDLTLKTPLLGYADDPIFGLNIIPVAHWAEGHVTDGSSFSQHIASSKAINIGNTILYLGGDYIHSVYDFNIQGEAHLEFGLISNSINYPIQISANLYSMNAGITHNFKHISINYTVRQIIPLFKRTDSSPIRFSESVPGKKVTSWGGQTHQISFNYNF